MIRPVCFVLRLRFAAIAGFASLSTAHAQIGYGVNAAGQLFRFDVNGIAPHRSPISARPLSFVPEGIDFRPSSSTLYAIDVGPNTTQLYTINISTGVPTAVGAGFNSTGPRLRSDHEHRIRIRLQSEDAANGHQHADSPGQHLEPKSAAQFEHRPDRQRRF